MKLGHRSEREKRQQQDRRRHRQNRADRKDDSEDEGDAGVVPEPDEASTTPRGTSPASTRPDLSRNTAGDTDDRSRPQPNYEVGSKNRPSTRHTGESPGPTSTPLASEQTLSVRRVPSPSNERSAIERRSYEQVPSAPLVALPRLSPLTREFLAIGHGRYRDGIDFINHNRNILSETDDVILSEAQTALRDGSAEYARRCVQQCLLLRGYRRPANEKMRFITGLLNPDTDYNRTRDKFSSEENTILATIRKGTETRMSDTIPSKSAASKSSATRQSNAPGHRYSENSVQYAKPAQYHSTMAGRRDPVTTQKQIISRSTTAPRQPMQGAMTSKHEPHHSTDFVVGSIFSVNWYQSSSLQNQDERSLLTSSQNGGHNQPAYSSYRRMVVVKQQHGCSWCLPIFTYQRQALLKPGLSEKDINMHAVLHMADKKPAYLEDEPRSTKRPIAVDAIPPHKFDPLSRLNFSKIYTVEHNLPVVFLGYISKGSMPFFLNFWKNAVSE